MSKSHDFIFILFYLCFWPKVKPETKNHLLRLRKRKTTTQPPLLSTTITPSQQNRWCWIFGRSFYTFWAKTNLILRQIQRWIWETQLIKPKSRGFLMEIIPGNPLQHPLLWTTITPSQQNRWRWIFGRSFYTFWIKTDLILREIQRWIWKKQLIKSKSRGFPMEIIPGNPLQHPLLSTTVTPSQQTDDVEFLGGASTPSELKLI